jgi:exodeoxyribonuclease VII large subunit
VAVRGELSGFTRAASGHCYFTLKDEAGQLRCAMFRRAAGLLGFNPREGDQVEVRGRLTVYEPRGDLQLVVESMQRAGQGALFEQFLRLKAKLRLKGCSTLPPSARCRPGRAVSAWSLRAARGAARRADGAGTARAARAGAAGAGGGAGAAAPAELRAALQKLYLLAAGGKAPAADLALNSTPPIDVILLVRGGGSIEDLWAFNDERVARTIAAPGAGDPGWGTRPTSRIADFVADLRAPTPTAAAELAVPARDELLADLDDTARRLRTLLRHRLESQGQRLDRMALKLARPAQALARARQQLQALDHRLARSLGRALDPKPAALRRQADRLRTAVARSMSARSARLDTLQARLTALDRC